MPADDLRDRLPERPGVQAAGEPQGAEEVVDVRPGRQLVEEPEALLGEGEGVRARLPLWPGRQAGEIGRRGLLGRALAGQAGQERQLLLARQLGQVRRQGGAHAVPFPPSWRRAGVEVAVRERRRPLRELRLGEDRGGAGERSGGDRGGHSLDGPPFEDHRERQLDMEGVAHRDSTLVAVSECPPKAKKSSARPPARSPAPRTRWRRASSRPGCAARRRSRRRKSARSPGGRARRSILPLPVKGSWSRTTKTAGTM